MTVHQRANVNEDEVFKYKKGYVRKWKKNVASGKRPRDALKFHERHYTVSVCFYHYNGNILKHYLQIIS